MKKSVLATFFTSLLIFSIFPITPLSSQVGVASSTTYPWPTFHSNNARTGYSSAQAPETNNLDWSYTTGGEVLSSPAVAHGKVFFGSTDGKLYARDQATGSFEWSYDAGETIIASPAVADGMVFFCTVGDTSVPSRDVYALNQATGSLVWKRTIGTLDLAVNEGSPAVANGKVFLNDGNGNLYCLDEYTGDTIWYKGTAGDSDSGGPAVSGGKVFAAGYWILYAFDEDSGDTLWSYYPGDPLAGNTVHSNKVFTCSDTKVIAVYESTGSVAWSRDLGTGVYPHASPAVADDKVFVLADTPDDRERVYALSESSGSIKWSRNLGYYSSPWPYFGHSSPAVADGKVYVGSWDNKVYCLNEDSGSVIWSYTTGNKVVSSPAVSDGAVFVGSWDHKVYAFKDITTTITVDPNGGKIYVDDNPIYSARSYEWAVGSTHPLDPVSGYSPIDGKKLLFTQWNDGNTQDPRTITVTETPCTYTAQWQIQYRLIIDVNPSSGGTTSPSPGTHWYNEGTAVTVTEYENSGYDFDHWNLDGNPAGTGTSILVGMTTSHILTAFFVAEVPPDFTVSVSPSSRTIIQGESTAYTVTVTSVNGFNSPVSLTVDGELPTGATASFHPNPVTPPADDSAESMLIIETTGTVQTGTYTLKVKGTDEGLTRYSNQITLVITSEWGDSDGDGIPNYLDRTEFNVNCHKGDITLFEKQWGVESYHVLPAYTTDQMLNVFYGWGIENTGSYSTVVAEIVGLESSFSTVENYLDWIVEIAGISLTPSQYQKATEKLLSISGSDLHQRMIILLKYNNIFDWKIEVGFLVDHSPIAVSMIVLLASVALTGLTIGILLAKGNMTPVTAFGVFAEYLLAIVIGGVVGYVYGNIVGAIAGIAVGIIGVLKALWYDPYFDLQVYDSTGNLVLGYDGLTEITSSECGLYFGRTEFLQIMLLFKDRLPLNLTTTMEAPSSNNYTMCLVDFGLNRAISSEGVLAPDQSTSTTVYLEENQTRANQLIIYADFSSLTPIEGETVNVSIFVQDENGTSIGDADVSVLTDDQIFLVSNLGGGYYSSSIDTSSLSVGDPEVSILASKPSYLQDMETQTLNVQVRVPQDYSTIQSAIDNAKPGHTIQISSGTYDENVIVYKSLTLLGEDRSTTIINGSGVASCFEVWANNVNITGFTMTNSGSDFPEAGIEIYYADNVFISRNQIFNCGFYSIFAYNASGVVIRENEIIDNPTGIYFFDMRAGNTITENLIKNSGRGIVLDNSGYNHVTRNTIANNDNVGILVGGAYNVFYCNKFFNNNDQVTIPAHQINIWNIGYPYGGNLWSDYSGTDYYGGPYQNELGSDGFGDTPYIIDADNQDNYPLVPVHNLDTNYGYLTIQAAINAPETLNGHTIEVHAGIYYENIAVIKSLTLIGEEKDVTIIDGNGQGTCITVLANNVNISRFTITNGEWYDIRITSSFNNIYGNNIDASGWMGIRLDESSNNRIFDNKIMEHQCNAISISANSTHNFVYENSIVNYGTGIVVSRYSSNNNIFRNNITTNETGIVVSQYSSNNNIFENNITANHWQGIELQYFSNYNRIYGNNIEANALNGIYVVVSSNSNIIYENNIVGNKWGISLYRSSNNLIYHNHFANNTSNVYSYDSVNVWDDGYPSGGNYWDDYNSTDLYRGSNQNETGSDGIGDTAHIIDENNTDHYPLIKPYGGQYDIGITNIATSKTVVGQGYSLNITVKTLNYGFSTETFNITIYANTTIVNQTQITLTSRNSTSIIFTWNTTSWAIGSYTISAYASQVDSETYTADNNFTNGWVFVTIAGDVTSIVPGVPDGIVNMRDIGAICDKFMTTPSHPDWDPNYDINGDGVVNMRDIGIACSNFMKTFE